MAPHPPAAQTPVSAATAIEVATYDPSPPAAAAVPEPQAGASAEPPQVVPIDDAEVGEFRRKSKAKKDEAREQIAWDANLSVFDDVDE